MVTGQVRAVNERDPRRRRVQVLDRHQGVRAHVLWAGNPKIQQTHAAGDYLHVRNGPGVRPYIAAKANDRWTWRSWPEGGPPRGEIFLNKLELDLGRRHAGRVLLEPTVKSTASPNKDWGWARWAKLAWLLQEKHGQRVTQLGGPATPTLEGAELIYTSDFRAAAAVLSTARAAVLPEGGLHHVAAAFNVPAVVIFGGFIAPVHTGYEGHVNLFTGGEACGMRVPCPHCREAMAKISPENVAERLMELLNVPAPGHLAA